MCLSIPAKVLEINGEVAKVTLGGIEYDASLQLVEDVKIGDYVLIHTGFAIQKLSEKEAQETLKLFDEFEELMGEELKEDVEGEIEASYNHFRKKYFENLKKMKNIISSDKNEQ